MLAYAILPIARFARNLTQICYLNPLLPYLQIHPSGQVYHERAPSQAKPTMANHVPLEQVKLYQRTR